MTTEELSNLTLVQRSIDRLTNNLEKLTDKLDGHIVMAAANFQDVKIDIAGVKNRFIGGWLVFGALGAIVAVVGSWIIQMHPHIQF